MQAQLFQMQKQIIEKLKLHHRRKGGQLVVYIITSETLVFNISYVIFQI